LPGLPETYLIEASASRRLGAFDVTPRFQSVLVQLGMGERWDAPVQLAVTHLLTRRWIGDAIRFTSAPEKASELGWFNDGVARYVAMRLLARAGFLGPDAWAQTIAGQLSTLATSPYASTGNAELATLVGKKPEARVAMMVRGALYAARESAAITARSKGDQTLEHVLVSLLHQARTEQKGDPLPASAWLDTVAKDDPDAARTFDALIVQGGPISLPTGALGPCFHAGTGDFVGFDPGFDLDATRAAKDAKVVGVRAGGPAAKAGLKDGDVVTSMHLKEGDARVPIALEIARDDASKTAIVSYLPAGVHARAQTWTRVKGVPDDRCGFPP
jgi:predicted metalloprotease with PDZ domain